MIKKSTGAFFMSVLLLFSLTGCGVLLDEFLAEDTQPAGVSTAVAGGSIAQTQVLSTASATQLSVQAGELQIQRRSRSSEQDMASEGWTIFLYLCGTDLETDNGSASEDLYDAISAKYSENVRLVVQTGGTQTWLEDISSDRLSRFVSVDGDLELVEELPAASMGDAQTLSNFIQWGVQFYPAANMGLILWNHGGGSISGVCFDELYAQDSLSLRELDSALNAAYDSMTEKFEFIGFDACLMGTLETANLLVPYAKYMYASTELEPVSGWDYTTLMNYLADNPNATGAELGAVQCESYYQHSIDNGDSEDSTFAVTDLSRLDNLLLAFDQTAQELYQSGRWNDIARSAQTSHNYGGNNRYEGYTNMVDLASLLYTVSPYAPSAQSALNALHEAVIHNVTAPRHQGTGGLSLYYPLAVQGSDEMSIFSSICTSPYYLALADAAVYSAEYGSAEGYDNSRLVSDCDNFWNLDYSSSENTVNMWDFQQVDENCPIPVSSVYLDEEGTYTVELTNFDNFYMAACSMFLYDTDGSVIYMGEDDDVLIDYDTGMITDNFDGTWVSLNGIPLPIEIVSQGEDVSVYTCAILRNGEETNLRMEYNWNTSEWSAGTTWTGMDSQTGMAARMSLPLQDGDVIAPLYYYADDWDEGYYEGDSYTVQGELPLYYDTLFAGEYGYSFALYDVYGNCFYTDQVTFEVDEFGEPSFYEDEVGYYQGDWME